MGYGPSVTTISPILSGEAGFAYSFAFSGINGAQPYTYTQTGTIPPGVSLSAAGQLSGTPSVSGAYSFAVQIVDAAGESSNPVTFGLTITPGLSITTTTLPSGIQGGAYSMPLVASGGVTPFTWSLVSGSLGPGLSLNANTGVIAGTPGAMATYTPTIQVSDALGYAVQQGYNLIIASNLAITTTSPLPSGVVGTPYSFTMSATGGAGGPYTWLITSGTLPTGLSFSTAGVFSGTPTASVTDSLTIQATDSGGTPVSAPFLLVINVPLTGNYVGSNTTGVTYFSPEQPFLNIFKQAGSNSRLGWFTSTSAAGLGETNEEGWLALDANGYITSLTATNGGVGNGSGSGGLQQYAGALTFINNALATPPGATVPYPTGSYTLQFQGQGTMILSGDVTSGSLASSTSGIAISGTTITSTMAPGVIATVTFSVAATTNGIKVGIAALPSNTNYFGVNTGISIVQTSLQASFVAGEMFHPLFKATWENISACRMMWWNAIIGDDWILTFAGGLPLNATSGTMSGISGGISAGTGLWPLPTGPYNVVFQTGQLISVNFTYQSAAVNWTTPLSAAVTAVSNSAEALTCITQSWAGRKTYTSAFWNRVPYEVQMQFCNELAMDPWMCIPAVAGYMDSSFAPNLAQLAFNGAGTTLPGFTGISSSQKSYIEYSNEVWNGRYASFNFCVMMGIVAFPTEGNIIYEGQEWYGTRVAGICDAFKAAYGSAFSSRVIVSMGGQTATGNGPAFMNIAMMAPQWVAQGNTAPYLHGVGGMHFAPYFTLQDGGSGTVPSSADIATILASANPLNTLFGLMYSNVFGGTTYSSVPAAGIVGAEIATLTSIITSLKSAVYGALPVFGYEGGSQWVAGSSNAAWLNLLIAAGRDPRIGYVYYDPTSQLSANPGFLPAVKTAGMQFLMHYVDVYTPSAFGVFGALESVMQPISPLPSAPPKFVAIQNYIESSTALLFNYYISPTGSDSNVGSLASPWAITGINTHQALYAGKNLGILPGTYDVSVLMQAAGYQGAVLQIQGGPNSSTKTYIGTCNSSGAYQAGTATLDAKGSVGSYGGGNTAHTPYVLGQTIGSTGTGPTPTAFGNWTIDGLLFTGFSNWAVTISGGVDTVPTQPQNCTIQNCGFFNSQTAQTGTHPGPLMLYDYKNCLVSNCWFYNNISTAATDPTHNGASITGEGFGGGSSGLIVQYCSFVQSPGMYIFQDNGAALNTTVQYCYFDMTTTTGISQTCAIAGCTGPATGQTGNSFHHNIVRGGSMADNVGLDAYYNGSAVLFYNNTWDRVGGSGGNSLGFRCLETTGQSGLISAYNNLMYDNGGGSVSYGYMAANVDGFALCDYNIYGTLNTFGTYGASGGTSETSRTFATWKTAIGKDAHSTTNATNPFTNNGTYALQYQISSGSPAYQTGFVGGVSSGAPCNVGAWDGTVTQIGCNLPVP